MSDVGLLVRDDTDLKEVIEDGEPPANNSILHYSYHQGSFSVFDA